MGQKEARAQKLQDVMLVISNYEQIELVDLISDLLSHSPIITNIVYDIVCSD